MTEFKVLQILPTFDVDFGGPPQNATGLNRGLNANKHTTAAISAVRDAFSSVLDDHLAMESFAESRLPLPDVVDIDNARSTIANVDALVLHGYYALWPARYAATAILRGTKYFLVPHGALGSRQQNYSKVRKAVFELVIGWWLRTFAAGVIVGSEREREEIVTRHPNLRVEVGGAGVVVPATCVKARPSTPLKLLSLSRITPKKRIDVQIRSVRKLIDEGHNVELLIAGTGDAALTTSLRQLSVDLDVDSRVFFLGSVHGKQKFNLLAEADIFLLPSEDENFGIGLAEALAWGVPSICTTAVAASSFMSASSGRVIHSPDVDELCGAVIELKTSERLSAARHSARSDALRNLDWQTVGKNWTEIMKSAGV